MNELVRRVARSTPAIVAASFLVALAIRVVAQIAYGSYGHPQTFEYDDIARSIVSGEGYRYRFLGGEWVTFGFPAVPLVLAFLHWIGGGPDAYGAVMVGLAALNASLAPLTYLIARRLGGQLAGLLAGAAVAVHPALVLFAVRVHELNVDAPLFALTLLVALEYAAGRTRLAVPLGALAGVSSLARPTIFLFAAVAMALLARRRPRRGLLIGAVVAAAIAAPWTIRTAALTGVVGTGLPYNCVTFWLGNDPYATGGPITADGRSVLDVMDEPLRSQVVGRPEAEQGPAFCAAADVYIREDPWRAVRFDALKYLYFWWFPPHAGIYYPAGLIDLYRPAWGLELILAAAGAAVAWRRAGPLPLAIVGLQLLVVSASQALGYVEGRHRLALEPTFAALAAIGALAILDRARGIFSRSVATT